MLRLFTDHPASVDEAYLEHMGQAFSFGIEMVVCGTACLLHGILPFAFLKTGSNAISRLHDRMVVNRNRHTPRVVTAETISRLRQPEFHI